MTTREAVILAGGAGSRLQPVVADRPKPMAEIDGRPFLEYLLDYLITQGIQKVILSVGYKHAMILNHFHASYKDLVLTYAVEETPLGTGGGLLNAFRQCTEESLFVVNGDTWFPVPLQEMEELFVKNHADLVMALHPEENPGRYGTILLDEHKRILHFGEKSENAAPALVNGGIYLMKRSLLTESSLPDSFSLEKDFLEKYTKTLRFFGMVSHAGFIDIGLPETYRRAGLFLPGSRPLSHKALFLDRDGTINVEKNYVFRKEDFKFREGIFEFAGDYYNRGYRIFVITNQAGIARGYFTEEDVNILHGWMRQQFMEKGIEISAVRYCPHHPDITGVCECRKPKPGMILSILEEYHLDAGECVLAGDKISDVEAGLRAGIGKNYLIRESGKITIGDVTLYKG